MQRKMTTTISNRKRSSKFFLYCKTLNVPRDLSFSIESSDMILMIFQNVFKSLKSRQCFHVWFDDIVQFRRIISKIQKNWLLRRSCSSNDLYTEHFVVQHSIFVPCPIGFKLLDMTARDDWIPSLETKRIIRTRQLIERANGTIVTVAGSVRIETISPSMIQVSWISVLRSSRNYYLLFSFREESVSLIRQYTVNFFNPNDIRAESQNANIVNGFIRRRLS